MAGADMSKNLGGMLSGAAGALGTMGSTYTDSLTRNIENISRPDADPTDVASQQSLMQWQNTMGRTDEAKTTMLGIKQMEDKRKAAEKQEAIGKAAKLTAAMRNLVASNDVPPDIKGQKLAEMSEQITALSAAAGKDLSGTLDQLQRTYDGEQRQVATAERQAQAGQQAQLNADLAAKDRDLTAEFFQQPVEERETFLATMSEEGSGALAAKLGDRMRQDIRWQEEREAAEEKSATSAVPAITAGEQTVIDADIASVKLLDEKLGKAWEDKFKAIKDDTELTTAMKRQQIGKMQTSLGQFVTRQTSAEMTAARTAKEEDKDLKVPAQGLYISDGKQTAPAVTSVTELMSEGRGGWATFMSAAAMIGGSSPKAKEESIQQAQEWVEKVGEAEAARLAATLVTTYPELSYRTALLLAASKNMGATPGGIGEVSGNDSGVGRSATNRIVLE